MSLLLVHAASAQSAPNIPQDPATSASAGEDTVNMQHVMDAFHDAVVSHDVAVLFALCIPEGSTWLNVLSDDAFAQAKEKKPGVAKVYLSHYKDSPSLFPTSR